MRGIIAGVLALAAMAGCRAAAPEAEAAFTAAAGHQRMVAALQGRFIWDCTLQAETALPPWRFVLQRQGEGNRADVVVLEAGQSVLRRADVQKNAAARVYLMPDGSKVLVASDGEVRSDGRSGSRGAIFTTGLCRKGGQSA